MEAAGVKLSLDGIPLWLHDEASYQDVQYISRLLAGDPYRLADLREIRPDLRHILLVGGHIGALAVVLRDAWPDSRLVIIEADPESVGLCRANLRENDCLDDRVFVLQGAFGYYRKPVLLSNVRSTARHVVAEAKDAADWLSRGGAEFLPQTPIHIEPLPPERIAEKTGCERFDLAILDAEGSEVDFLQAVTPQDAERFELLTGCLHWDHNGLAPVSMYDFLMFRRRLRKRFPNLAFDFDPIYHNEQRFRAWPLPDVF